VRPAVLQTSRFASAQVMEGATSCAAAVPKDTIVREFAGVPEKPVLCGTPPLGYPHTARERGIQGRGLVAMGVKADGSVDPSSAAVVAPVDPELDLTARGVRAVRRLAPRVRLGAASARLARG
jgi:outer membrane biosynthesis protein TonB